MHKLVRRVFWCAALGALSCGGAGGGNTGGQTIASREKVAPVTPARRLKEPKQPQSIESETNNKPAAKAPLDCPLDGALPSDVSLESDAETLHELGQQRIMAKDGPQAVAILARAHQKAPDDASILGDLATALLQCRLYDQAIERMERAAELDPNDVDIAANLAQAYQIAGRLDDAIAGYEKAIEAHPNDPGVHNNLAVLVVLRDLGRAENAARAAVNLDPKNPTYLINLGYILLRRNRLVDAEIILRRALDLDPNSADAHNQLGLVFAAQKRNYKALESFRHALQINPNHRAARENIQALDQGFDFIGPWSGSK